MRHGVNGLIVPAADAGALASALDRLASSADLLARAARRARPSRSRPAPSTTRSPGSSPASQQLLAGGPGQPVDRASAPARDPAACTTCCSCAASRVRRCATGPGCRPRRWPCRASAARSATTAIPSCWPWPPPVDVVVFYRVPATSRCSSSSTPSTAPGCPAPSTSTTSSSTPTSATRSPPCACCRPDEAALWLQGIERYRTTLEACDAYIGSTPMLVERAAELTGLPAHRFDNGVGLALARPADRELRRPRPTGPLRIGYLSGTTTHDEDWFFVEPAVVEVLDRHPDVELWLGGHLPDSPALDRFGARVVRLPFTPVARAAGRAPRPRREPVAPRPRQPVQRGQERHQVARGRADAPPRPSPARPGRSAMPSADGPSTRPVPGRRSRRLGRRPRRAAHRRRRPGPASAPWPAAGPCSSGPRRGRASATPPSSRRSRPVGPLPAAATARPGSPRSPSTSPPSRSCSSPTPTTRPSARTSRRSPDRDHRPGRRPDPAGAPRGPGRVADPPGHGVDAHRRGQRHRGQGGGQGPHPHGSHRPGASDLTTCSDPSR